MCTVSFLPLENDNFILTSNRDETPLRKTISPKIYQENDVELLYPKDAFAGGTWIGASNRKRLVCLLNGAFEKHHRKEFYRKSRGIIVTELLAVEDAVSEIHQTHFLDIEPFTLVLIDFKKELKVFELIWDGEKKHFQQLDLTPKIWSSATLYNQEMTSEREVWFAEWLQENKVFSQDKILTFHQDATKGTQEIALKMKRTFVETVSITSIKKRDKILKMTYLDLLDDAVMQVQMKI
ncbi:NRDE family protein [Polaribacter sp. BAL334]|uniref:NRDE family protein n=1 Tax=Polaribacter sp. BAL334 TaxID=1708178 RepID=UPI0018D22A0B|nr:NRDE family protein [Polaribacter sp. BAL334]MBG7610975.1 NRDE family protein [Polaribacter sp. BAL334]